MSLSVREERAFEGGHGQLEEWDDGRLTILCLARNDTSGYRLNVPNDRRDDPWEWFAERKELGAREETMQMQAIRAEGIELGYSLLLEQSIDDDAGTRWLVSAAARVSGQATVGRPIARAMLREEALEIGLEIVKAHVERGEQWPDAVLTRRRQFDG